MREKAAAHHDLAMDAPDGELDALLTKGKVPGANMIVDTVNERAVEIEEECDRGGHASRIMEVPWGSHFAPKDLCNTRCCISPLDGSYADVPGYASSTNSPDDRKRRGAGALKGAPLMRFFKAGEPQQSEEDRARDARLTAIASRYRVEVRDNNEGRGSGPLEIRDMLQ